jgi:GTPase SAR1 family protein
MEKEPTFIYFVGTAGAGKTSLVGATKEWCTRHGIDAITLNLDPGVERLPYEPDIDVRDWVKLKEVMETHGLGPNGAQIAACDMIALQGRDIEKALEEFRADYVLVDTPGQIELFVFRQSGKYITQLLNPEQSMIAYLLDPILAKSPSGFVSQLLLSTSVQFRLGLPVVHLLSKADLLSDDELKGILSWSQDPLELERSVEEEAESLYREMSIDLFRVIHGLGALPTLYPTSAESGDGIDDIYSHIQQLFGGGEDIGSDETDKFQSQPDAQE